MSNLVNETKLNYYTIKLWDKIKRDLTNGTFVNAQILPNGTTLQFTKKDGTAHDVDLSNFLRRNELTQNGGTNQQANMIPQLGADGKIHISMLPNIPFNNLHVVGTKNDIENMINVGTATAGDMFFVRDTNKVFIFANDQAPAFDDKIVEVGDKDGYVKTVNGLAGNPDGNIEVSLKKDVDNLSLVVGGQDFGTVTLDYLKDADTTNVGGAGQNNKVVRLDNNGLLDVTMLPEVAINRYYPVVNLADAEAQKGNYQNGDIIYAQDTQKTYLVINNDGANNFQQDAIIELTPQAGINLPIEATEVNYDKNQTNLNATNVQEAIDEVYDKFKGGYVTSNFNPQTGQLTLNKHEGNPDVLNLGVHVENAQLDNNTNTLKLIKADATTIDVPLDPILIANKITFTPGATGMVAQNVQAAIEELNGKIPTDIINNVEYDGNKTLTITKNGIQQQPPIDLSPLVGIKTINQVIGNPDGDIEVGLRKNVDDLYLTVGGQDKAQIQLDYLKDADTTNVGGQPNADKIVKLGADGKLHQTMIPEIAISRVLTAVDKQAAINLIGDTDAHLQTGDVVVLTGEKNAVYMFNGTTPAGVDTFADGFIQLHLGDGTVKTVNRIQPDGTGNVELTTAPVFDGASMKLNTNGSNVEFTSVECYTDQDVVALIATFI